MSSLANIGNPSNLKTLLPILASSTVVDTAGIFLWKTLPADSPINKWYSRLGLIAYGADIISLVIAIVLAQFIFTFLNFVWNPLTFIGVVLAVQVFHDVSFAKIILPLLKKGDNEVVDIMKEYVTMDFSVGILFVDAIYCILTALGTMILTNLPQGYSVLLLAVWLYVGMFILKTRPAST
jgi:hypothetical protein